MYPMFLKRGSMACPSWFEVIRFCHRYVASDPEQPFMGDILDNPLLRERKFVFSNRYEGGKQLGALNSAL
jgi:hypothetical protein